jgi:pyridoxal phosphate enzyme (YggS family)
LTPDTSTDLRRRHEQLLGRLRDVAAANGHDADKLRIVGVTKTHPPRIVRQAFEAGITRLGENRVQEAEPKIAAVPDAEWHFVGRLQSNKVRRVVRAFAVVHSIDSPELLERLDAVSAEEARVPSVLLQVNVTGEASKAGMAPEALGRIRELGNAKLVGLMTIAPMGVNDQEARAVFWKLRDLRDRLQDRIGVALPELSMGMSADAEAAAAEGATLVRIGTALFGPRA